MKQPASFAEAVFPAGTNSPSKEKEKIEMISLQVFLILALDKEYEGYEIKHFLKHVYTNRKYVETSNSLRNRKYYEFILVDTGSVDIEH